MEAEARHLHAQIWIPKTDRNNIRKALFRIAEKHDPDWGSASKKVLSNGVRYCYNDDFINEYVTKDSELEYSNIPEDTFSYYPSEEEQEKLQAKKKCADAYFDRLKDLWLEQNPDYQIENYIISQMDVALFYYDQMFKDKVVAVVRDDRQRKQNAKCLYHYIYPSEAPKKEMVATAEQIEQYNIHIKMT